MVSILIINNIISIFLVWMERVISIFEELCPGLQSTGQEAKEMAIYSLHEWRQDSRPHGFLCSSLQRQSALFTRLLYKPVRVSFSETKSLITRIDPSYSHQESLMQWVWGRPWNLHFNKLPKWLWGRRALGPYFSKHRLGMCAQTKMV